MAGDNASGNLDGDLILAILGMEMGRGMITVIHTDDDPEKSGNFRHIGKLGDLGRTFNYFRRSWSMSAALAVAHWIESFGFNLFNRSIGSG